MAGQRITLEKRGNVYVIDVAEGDQVVMETLERVVFWLRYEWLGPRPLSETMREVRADLKLTRDKFYGGASGSDGRDSGAEAPDSGARAADSGTGSKAVSGGKARAGKAAQG